MSSSATAEYMALFRALETSRPNDERLFSDPYARRFLRTGLRLLVGLAQGRPGRWLVDRVLDRLWPGARASGVARTRLIDDALGEALERGVEQVVVLGAGFDCRSLRVTRPSGSKVFEVDRPQTQERKRRRLNRIHSDEAAVTYVPCDFEEMSLDDCLTRSGFDCRRSTFFIWEGVTNYLHEEAIDSVLRFVAAAAPGSSLLFTYVDRLVIDEPQRFRGSRLLRSILRRSHEPWTFGLDPALISDFLKSRGLRLVMDAGSVEYRARYLGPSGDHLDGYEFYRVAIAAVDSPAQGG